MNNAKFPISDADMLALLGKYPFLKHRNYWKTVPDDCYHTDKENIEYNYYKYWDGSGWEDLWKNRYLPRLFKEYDSWDDKTKSGFFITDTKEKFGELRIYTSFSSGKSLESIAEWLSGYTCQHCGAEPRIDGIFVGVDQLRTEHTEEQRLAVALGDAEAAQQLGCNLATLVIRLTDAGGIVERSAETVG